MVGMRTAFDVATAASATSLGGVGQVPQRGGGGCFQQVIQGRSPGGAATWNVDTIKPITPVCDLHERQGCVEEERGDNKTPDQVKSSQAVGEMSYGPEDPQTGSSFDQPAKRRRPIKACRRTNLGSPRARLASGSSTWASRGSSPRA